MSMYMLPVKKTVSKHESLASSLATNVHIKVRWLSVVFPIIVQISPGQARSVPGGSAVFQCTAFGHTTVRIYWLVNGTQLEELHLKNVTEVFVLIGGGVGTLIFTDLPVYYNTTRIQCQATFSSGETFLSTNRAILFIFSGKRLNA